MLLAAALALASAFIAGVVIEGTVVKGDRREKRGDRRPSPEGSA
jgi:hypothetical protein